MKHLPYKIVTATKRKYRTAHGLTSCRRMKQIDAYDGDGSQHSVFTADITSHSQGELFPAEKST